MRAETLNSFGSLIFHKAYRAHVAYRAYMPYKATIYK